MTRTQQPEFNPYAAPQADGVGTTDYFRVVGTKISYAECWRMANNPWMFLIAALFKTLRLPFLMKNAFCLTRRHTTVEGDAIPEHVRAIWAEPLADAERLGFRRMFYRRLPTLGQSKESMTAVLLSPDATVVATLIYVRVHVVTRLVERVAISASSWLRDGHKATTCNYRDWLKKLPDAVSQRVPGRHTFAEVVEAHREWLWSRGWEAQPVDEAGLAEMMHRREQEVIAYHQQRGVFRQMTEGEVEAFSRISPQANALALTDADRRFFRICRLAELFLLIVSFAAMGFLVTRPLGGRSMVPLLVVWLSLVVLLVLNAMRSAETRAIQRRS